jgi:GT2 family glycosyltransferase
MKQPSPPARPKLRASPDGVIEAVLPSALRGARPAIELDGILHGFAEPADRSFRRFTFPLPQTRLFGALDLLSPTTRDTLIGAPFPLADTYGVAMAPISLEGHELIGGFTASGFLAGEIGVEFHDGATLVASAIAVREPGLPPRWRFRAAVHTLPRPGETRHLLPSIGGLRLRGPRVTLPADSIGFLGCLDSASPHRVAGWAIDLRAPARRVELDVLVNARKIATLMAGEERPDLAGLAGSDGFCGFSVELPERPTREDRQLISLRLAGQRTELAGSPALIDLVPNLHGMFDALHGMAALGWAINRAEPETPVEIEIVAPDGTVLGRGAADLFRGDLLDAGLNGGHCAFKIDLAAHFERLLGQEVIARIAGTAQILPGSPQRITINPNIRHLLHRRQNLKPGVLPRLKRALNHRAGEDGVSFIMPVHNTPRLWLIEALESVRAQFCDAWELICVDDGSTEPQVRDVLDGYSRRDRRVRVLRSPENVGIARAINFGLRAARYNLVAFLDHDDRLEPDAAWQLIRGARLTNADLLYSDEAQTAEHIDAITELRLRPAFSHDYYLSHPYFVHLVCARTELARRIGGWDETMAISADVDFILRMIEAARIVTHVPAVLYRWRTHGASTGHAKQDAVMAATTASLQRHLDRLRTGATVAPGVWFNQFRIDWPASSGKILIVIPTKNKGDLLKTAIESIERTSPGENYRIVVIDHASDEPDTKAYLQQLAKRHVVMPYRGKFNFSRMNNKAVAAHGGDCDFLLFLNNDIEATQNGWLDRLKRLAHRRDVGAVGALLMYADQTVQHAGVILGFNDSAEHALKFQPVFLNTKGRRNLGYNCALSATRDYSAVTAACLMLRRKVFEEIGGFDENFAIGFNDTDLCLRIKAAGYRNLYDGTTILFHYESATRSQTKQVFHPEDTRLMITRWGEVLQAGDDFYHPNLSLRTQDHVPLEGERCRVVAAPRATVLDHRRMVAR